MSDFKAKMHQIRFPLGLHLRHRLVLSCVSWNILIPRSESYIAWLPTTPLGELTALPQTPQLYLRGLLLRGGTGKGREKGRKERKGEGKWRGERPYAPPVENSWLRH